MVNEGQRVRIGAAGVSVFIVAEISEDGQAILDPLEDAGYRFPMPVSALVPDGAVPPAVQ
ncbi:hypothetical protein ACFQZZ_33345 [Nocardia sp. GCM10030253]|uniref:hypothetical protein n=1 Tax=Nocardia sp. GCM10030253 TaxID=3273404 RepID=UPI003640E23F